MAACGLRVGKTRIGLGASAEVRYDLRIKKDPSNNGPSNSVLPSPLTLKGVLLLSWPSQVQAILYSVVSLPQQETLPRPFWESGLEGPHRVSPVTGVFPGQLSAIISLFLWKPHRS